MIKLALFRLHSGYIGKGCSGVAWMYVWKDDKEGAVTVDEGSQLHILINVG